MSYKLTYTDIKPMLKSQFGRTLTEEQIDYIRRINDDNWADDEYNAIATLIGEDLYIITEEQDNQIIGYNSTEFTIKI